MLPGYSLYFGGAATASYEKKHIEATTWKLYYYHSPFRQPNQPCWILLLDEMVHTLIPIFGDRTRALYKYTPAFRGSRITQIPIDLYPQDDSPSESNTADIILPNNQNPTTLLNLSPPSHPPLPHRKVIVKTAAVAPSPTFPPCVPSRPYSDGLSCLLSKSMKYPSPQPM